MAWRSAIASERQRGWRRRCLIAKTVVHQRIPVDSDFDGLMIDRIMVCQLTKPSDLAHHWARGTGRAVCLGIHH